MDDAVSEHEGYLSSDSPPIVGQVPLGLVLGRFQVLHHSHMRYILAARERCDFFLVGITNPDPMLTAGHVANPHRSLPSANPLTFYERATMIRDSLFEAGVDLQRFMIIPFPINRPEFIRYYAPLDALAFITIYDEWGRIKLATLQRLGFTVEVLWEKDLGARGYSSSEIRDRIVRGEPWEFMVPDAVGRFIKQISLADRLVRLKAEEQEMAGR